MYGYKRRQFRFENAWLVELELPSVVSDGWMRGQANPLLDSLALCTEELDQWGRSLRRRYKEDIEKCKKRIAELQTLSNNEADIEVVSLKERLNLLLIQEETFSKQIVKSFWLRDGDMNSKFFHAAATSRKQHNKITKLMKDDNTEVTTQEDICTLSLEYFSNLFAPTTCNTHPVLQAVAPCINAEDSNLLTAPFSDDEFKDVVYQMHLDKSPGPDGLNPTFYKRFWALCGGEVIKAWKQLLNLGYLPSALGETNIVLIPKCEHPRTMKDLRPISLCNVVYKILAKALAKRLQRVLDKCILEEQSGFVAGRSITDNVLVASEIIHHLKCKTRGNKGRGLRQDDPLSPYLFILCAEGMTSMIKQAERNNILHGIKVCRRAPSISHLLFADDSFLFFRANEVETNALKKILDDYANASGQMINMQKSEIFFSRNVSTTLRNTLSSNRMFGYRKISWSTVHDW